MKKTARFSVDVALHTTAPRLLFQRNGMDAKAAELRDGVSDGDRYELVGELASGGMATVWLARMRRPMGFSRLVAVKCMHPQFAKDPAFATMFVDEARLTARLRHPNIVATLDIVSDEGHLLLVMEYIEGAAVSALLKANWNAKSRIPIGIAAAVVHDLLLGLHAAHEAADDDGVPLSIVHRDVSPQNVIVGIDGHARVLDFGVAKARQNVHHSIDTEIKGKIPYMPPEQLCGEALDRRVDVYAAGVILWELLTGRRLFEGPSETVIARRVLDDVVVPPSARIDGISSELDALVMKALAREANDRFANAEDMAHELARIVALAPRAEVASWVKTLAPPQVKPLTAGPRPFASAELPEAAPPSSGEATTIVAVLERAATRHGQSGQRDSLPPMSIATPAGSPPSLAGSRRARFAGVLLAAACLLTGVGLTKATSSDKPATPAAPRPAETTEATAIVVAPVTSPVVTATAAPEPKAAPVKIAPRIAPKVESAPVPQPAATVTDNPACRPPYTVDGDGHRHYKVECI